MARRLVLCLDGTWNSTYAGERRDDGHMVLKPSNTLKVARAVCPRDGNDEQLTYYDTGLGSLGLYPGAASYILTKADKVLGGLWGAGFEANVEDALHFLALNHQPGDDVFLFGFSRGAATARAVTRFLDWAGGLPCKSDAYYLPILFRRYVDAKGAPEAFETALADINRPSPNRKTPKPPLEPFIPVRVKYLGIWDSVFSLGSRFKATGASTSDAGRTFHAGKAPAKCVEMARHALAIDEARFDFRAEVWTENNPQTHRQRWFSGVHSNVGGGYTKDGLANIAFRWVLEGAKDAGLRVDAKFVAHYKPFVLDSLYESSSPWFRIAEAIRFRKGRGKRPLTQHPSVELDPSVIKRIQARPEKIAEFAARKAVKTAYRPANVIELLATKPDLTAYLQSLGVQEPLPADVEERIRELKARGMNAATMAPEAG